MCTMGYVFRTEQLQTPEDFPHESAGGAQSGRMGSLLSGLISHSWW